MKKILAILLVLVIGIGLFSGCGKKVDPNADPLLQEDKEKLVDMIRDYELEILTDEDEIDRLKDLLKGIGGGDEKSPGIVDFEDGTGRLTFNSVNSVIDISSNPFNPNV